jgi:hypothetical protein
MTALALATDFAADLLAEDDTLDRPVARVEPDAEDAALEQAVGFKPLPGGVYPSLQESDASSSSCSFLSFVSCRCACFAVILGAFLAEGNIVVMTAKKY